MARRKELTAGEMGKMGGRARALKMTAEERSASCQYAAKVRWRRYRAAKRQEKLERSSAA